MRLFFVSVGTIFVHFGPFWKIWHSAWTLKMSAYSYILFCVPLFPSDLSALFKKTDSTLVVFDLPLQFFLFLFKMLCSHVRVFMQHFRLHSGTRVFPYLSFVVFMFLFLCLSSFLLLLWYLWYPFLVFLHSVVMVNLCIYSFSYLSLSWLPQLCGFNNTNVR